MTTTIEKPFAFTQHFGAFNVLLYIVFHIVLTWGKKIASKALNELYSMSHNCLFHFL